MIIIFVYCSLVVATRIPDFTTVRVAQQTNDPKYLCYMGFTADIIITDCIVSDCTLWFLYNISGNSNVMNYQLFLPFALGYLIKWFVIQSNNNQDFIINLYDVKHSK